MLYWPILSLIISSLSLKVSEPVRWPSGRYGIPKPMAECPRAKGFAWEKGWRYQDTEDTNPANSKSPQLHLDGVVAVRGIERSFCMKTSTADDNNRPHWPSGQYCIYQKKKICPLGLESGQVYWDDENDNNNNEKSGVLPTGKYGKNTKISFCCATSGNKTDPIIIPAKDPFFLLAYGSEKCQMVKWAVASVEWIRYHTEDSNNQDKSYGVYPYNAGTKSPTIYYCYYRGCNETLTSINGTFHSPNYPRTYPDGQCCSWRITINQTQRIRMTFTNFSLQYESDTDELYVYDGENATGKILGVFYGAHPPPEEGIFSSSNHLFVMFRSDSKGSYAGFNVSYYGVSFPTTQTTEITHVFHTKNTTSDGEPKPTSDKLSKKGGVESGEKQPQRRGVNVVAVVIPVVLAVLLVCMGSAVLFYITRSRKASAVSTENPNYDSTLVTANTNEINGLDGIELYAEVKNQHDVDDSGQLCCGKENENPSYEPAKSPDAAVVNPIYERNRMTEFSGDDLYSEVKEQQNCDEVPCMEYENENPLYESAASDDILMVNPIYDSFT